MKAFSCSFPKRAAHGGFLPQNTISQKKKGSLRRLLGESFFRRLG
jgi:hypothetical protein